ncbi:MAG: hypothetical protein FWB90_08660 [Fibromonadales bacterium]|nr:hypothetical protein [Fibromonadales bacterium]
MKKLFLLLISGFLLIGCVAPAYKNNTLQAVKMEAPDIEALPVTADLSVSEQKATVEVEGNVLQRDILKKEAVAKALGQDPPSLDKPDVLVGVNVFEEITADKLKLTVTGYPAYYVNFRTATEKDELLSMEKAGPILLETEKGNANWYFTMKYLFGDNFNFGLGFGAEWPNGFLLGLEGELGVLDEFSAGGGFNIGFVNNKLPNDIKLIGGIAAGFWLIERSREACYNNYYNNGNYYTSCYDDYISNKVMFGGPFAKIRWKFFETGARVLLGTENNFHFSLGFAI